MEDLPEVDVIIAPVGAGSGACGHCITAKTLSSRVRVIGVQAEGAPPVYRTLTEGRMVESDRMETFAEGLATRVPFPLPITILHRLLDEIVLVSDEDLRRAMLLLGEAVRQTAEGAGAASTAAALRVGERLRGKTVALILSGGNVPVEAVSEIYADRARVAAVSALLRGVRSQQPAGGGPRPGQRSGEA
jgi:threonine dehydratase